MWSNYIKSTFRNFRRNLSYALINIIGLSIALSIFIALTLYIQFELSFEDFNPQKENIYRIEQNMIEGGRSELMETAPVPLWRAIKAEFPEVKESIRLFYNNAGTITTPEGRDFETTRIITDREFFEFFSYKLKHGDPSTALQEPNCVVLTESLANVIFGDENPMGKIIDQQGFGFPSLKITGIMYDPPKNTHLEFNSLISMATIEHIWGTEEFNQWGNNWLATYVKLIDNHDIIDFNKKIKHILKKFWKESTNNELKARNIKDIHLYSPIAGDYALRGSISNLYILMALAVFIIFMAGVNFTNLAVAYSTKRKKEVGLRKISGANKNMLITQFLSESIVIAFISLILAFVIFETFLPWFNQIVKRELDFNYLNNFQLLGFIIIVTLFFGILSGLYPAYVISKSKPFDAIKGISGNKVSKSRSRRILVAIQFIISACFIIGTLGILRQVNYLKNKDQGFETKNMIRIIFNDSTMNRINYFRNQILQNPDIEKASVHDYPIHNSSNWTRASWEGAKEKEYIRINNNYADHHYIDCYNMKLIAGEGFVSARTQVGVEENQCIINEAAAKRMRITDNPIGVKVKYYGDYRDNMEGNRVKIVGVVKDFHFSSARNKITPMIIHLYNPEETGWCISVKVKGENMQRSIQFLNEEFLKVFPAQSFNYYSVKDEIAQYYTEEEKLASVVLGLSIISIFIACLGIYGLVSFSTATRRREIGIRKVLGSKPGAINILFFKEFFLLIIIANAIAWPLSYLSLDRWLESFPYHVEHSLIPGLTALGITMLFALLSMLSKTVYATKVNPVETLRYE